MTVINRIEFLIRKISKSQRIHTLWLSNELEEDNRINEFSEQELIGLSSSFDWRTGNKYTRRSNIKDIYNKLCSSEDNLLDGTAKNNNK